MYYIDYDRSTVYHSALHSFHINFSVEKNEAFYYCAFFSSHSVKINEIMEHDTETP